MAATLLLRPLALWQAEVGGDWQPLALRASAAAEDAYAAWASGRGPAQLQVRSGQAEFHLDFTALQHGDPPLRREEVYPKKAVDALLDDLLFQREARLEAEAARALLQSEVEGLRREVDSSPKSQHRQHVPQLAEMLESRRWTGEEELTDRAFALPSHRTLRAGAETFTKHCGCSRLGDADPRSQWLRQHFLASFKAHRFASNSVQVAPRAEIEICGVIEVYNPMLAQAYRHELDLISRKWPAGCEMVPELEGALRVRTDLGGPNLNEALLFHGCHWTSFTGILEEGLDCRLYGSNAGAAFGGGAYLSSVASKADFYTDTHASGKRQREHRVMLVVRAALGRVYEARHFNSTLARPPTDQQGVRYDSVMGVPRARGGSVDFDEFVVYKLGQAIPQFVLVYKHKPSCLCRTCTCPSP